MSQSLNRLRDEEAGKNALNITNSAMPMAVDSANGNIISAILASYFFAINILSIPSRLLMRKNMGERVFTVFAFVLSTLVFLLLGLVAFWFGLEIFVPLMDFRNIEISENIPRGVLKAFLILVNPYTIFFILFLQKGATHFNQALDRARNNKYKYSFSLGDSLYFNHKKAKKFLGFGVDDKLLVMIYEPWGILTFSIPMIIACVLMLNKTGLANDYSIFSYLVNMSIAGIMTVSIAFSLSAICLFLEEFGSLLKERGTMLDMLDGEIDMQRIITSKEKQLIERPGISEGMENNLLN